MEPFLEKVTRPPPDYYPRVTARRLAHYAERRLHGYDHLGSLPTAAAAILSPSRGFRAGSHYEGAWIRDLAFAAPAIVRSGHEPDLRRLAERILDFLDDTFYTDIRETAAIPTPAEGIDTFPAVVILLDELDMLAQHEDQLLELSALHRERFYHGRAGIVEGLGSAWWDSVRGSRETYNTAMLLAAHERLEARRIDSAYADTTADLWHGLDSLWNGTYFAERRGSSVLACDANVIPLYFELLSDARAASIVAALERLETDRGLRMRERPFAYREIRLPFLLHRDYHYHVWPWNSFAYANGLAAYGYHQRADAEVGRIEARLERYGNFLEILHLDGGPYIKRGYASAQDFLVAAALWTEYHARFGTERS